MTLKALRVVLVAAAAVIVVVIFWIDISTDIWQDYVVLSGLAAGLVTFALTALVIDRVIARSAHERWAPVTRLALGDLRRRLVADPSAASPDEVRRLPRPGHDPHTLVEAAAAERDALTAVLARWASFLSASADVLDIMDAIAEVSERLDSIERMTGAVDTRELVAEIDAYHRAGDRLLAHIEATLSRYERLAASADR